jgi:hypothetical protein
MAAVPPALNAIQPLPEAPASITKLEALGMKLEIPLPKWAVACLAILLIVGGWPTQARFWLEWEGRKLVELTSE